MKKKVKKLKLNKETLGTIDTDFLRLAGAAVSGHDTCISWCNICYTKERTFCDC